jgi:glycosyltransferase involved in cell wall biosynthesis
LRIADRLSDAVLTSLPGSYPFAGLKVQTIGQAIDVGDFAFAPRPRGGSVDVVGIGRTSPSKGFATMIRAIARVREAGVDARLRIVGPSTTAEERRHLRDLETLMRERLGDAGRLDPGVPHSEIPAVLSDADVLVSDMVAGSGDKVVFEASAIGRLVLVSNPSFGEFLGDLPIDLCFPRGDDVTLANRICAVATASERSFDDTTRELRNRVVGDHSLDRWAQRVVSIARGDG